MAIPVPITQGVQLATKGMHYGMPAYFAYSGYQTARDEGHGVLNSMARSAAEYAMFDFMYGGLGLAGGIFIPMGVELLKNAPSMAVSAYDSLTQQSRQMERINRDQRPFQNYTFVDSPQIYTQRQAGLALAAQSKYKLQETMLGNEARYMHR